MLPFCYSGILFAYIAIFALFPLIPGFAVPGKNLSALMITAGMVGTVVGIIAAKTYPLRIPLIRYSGLVMTIFIALMILTTNQAVAYGAAFLVGFFMFLPMTAMVTLPQELPGMTPGRVTVVFGMFWSISYVIETDLDVRREPAGGQDRRPLQGGAVRPGLLDQRLRRLVLPARDRPQARKARGGACGGLRGMRAQPSRSTE